MQILNQSLSKQFKRKIISPWKSIPLMDRWLIVQILPPMLFAISAFTVISLSVGVMFDLIRKIVEYGLPLFTAILNIKLKFLEFRFVFIELFYYFGRFYSLD